MQTEKEHRIIYNICSFCGERFPCVRTDAKFCKPAHRAKYYRWRKKLPATTDRARAEIRDMATYLDYEVSRATAVEYFNALIAEMRATMEAHGIRFVR